MIELTLPYPISVNAYKKLGRLRRTRTGALYQPRINSDATKRYFYQVWHIVQQAKAKDDLKVFEDITQQLQLEIDVFPPDLRPRDLDNILKVGIDSLQNAGVIANDYQIGRLVVQRYHIIKEGQIIVRISQL